MLSREWQNSSADYYYHFAILHITITLSIQKYSVYHINSKGTNPPNLIISDGTIRTSPEYLRPYHSRGCKSRFRLSMQNQNHSEEILKNTKFFPFSCLRRETKVFLLKYIKSLFSLLLSIILCQAYYCPTNYYSPSYHE